MRTETTIAVVAAIIAMSSMIAAFWQAGNARRQTNLQQQMIKDAAEPYVWVDIRPDDRDADFFHLILKNEGPTVAEDVHIAIDPPLPEAWRPSGSVGPQYSDFASLPPGRTMVWNLGLASEIVATDTERRFDVTITASGPYGPLAPRTYRLDLSRYNGHVRRAPGTLSGIAKAIDDLTKQVKKCSAELP